MLNITRFARIIIQNCLNLMKIQIARSLIPIITPLINTNICVCVSEFISFKLCSAFTYGGAGCTSIATTKAN